MKFHHFRTPGLVNIISIITLQNYYPGKHSIQYKKGYLVNVFLSFDFFDAFPSSCSWLRALWRVDVLRVFGPFQLCSGDAHTEIKLKLD